MSHTVLNTALSPDEMAWRLTEILKNYLNLSRKPEFQIETIYDSVYGPSFVPVALKADSLSEDQRQKACALLKPLFQPLSDRDLKSAYDRLRLSCAGNRLTPDEEKTRQDLFCKALADYPPCVVYRATAHPYKWFPGLGELLEVCQNENRYLGLIKTVFYHPDPSKTKGK